MNSFRKLMDTFDRDAKERNDTNLIEILRNKRTYFQNISKDDRGTYN